MQSIGPKDLHGLTTRKYKCRFFAQKQAQNDVGKVVAGMGNGGKRRQGMRRTVDGCGRRRRSLRARRAGLEKLELGVPHFMRSVPENVFPNHFPPRRAA